MSLIVYGERRLALFASILVSFWLVVASPAYGQSITESKEPLTLQQALELTLEQNPSLNVFQFRQKVLDGERLTAAQKPAYQIGAELENVAGNGEFSGVDSAELTVSLSSAIELGGKVDARLGVIKSKRTVVETKKELQALELLSETTRRYVNLLAAQERVKLAEESLQLAKETLRVAQRRANLGATMKAEVKRAKASLAQAELTLHKEASNLKVYSASLQSMWSEKISKNLLGIGELISLW